MLVQTSSSMWATISIAKNLARGGPTNAQNHPVGYGWNVWELDFFAPSARLLAAAPWIMVRGNHEMCKRAGEGWFRFLDHGPFPKKCPNADIGVSFLLRQ